MGGLLIIGYGNPLRGDDGAGPEAARRVERLGLPGVVVIACHQLLPEHAEILSRVGHAIFVDAHRELARGPIQVSALTPSDDARMGSHASDPAALMALSRALYGRAPAATLIAVPAVCFDLKEELSVLAAAGVDQAVAKIRRLHASFQAAGT